ncbi:MAG: hypothetical protein WBB68_04060 [Candidatus Moraniibacteriota bacterium]
MHIEEFQPGKPVEQIIAETIEDLERGLYDEPERTEVVAALETARVLTMPGSDGRKKIEALLREIDSRYGKA